MIHMKRKLVLLGALLGDSCYAPAAAAASEGRIRDPEGGSGSGFFSADPFHSRGALEQTVVDAVLDRKTGAFLSAGLEDVRVLKERTGCDGELEHCSPQMPLLARRDWCCTMARW